MNDNVIKFQKRKAVKPPRQTPPWLRRLMIISGVVIAIGLIYAYFALTIPA